MDLQQLAQQYRGTTLPKLLEKQIKAMDKRTLLQAIQGTYKYFPENFRPLVDAYTLTYGQKLIGSQILIKDLGDVFRDAIQDAVKMSIEAGESLNDDQVFAMFNLTVMRLSFMAHSEPGFRKLLGIKKGWFS